MKNKKPTLKRNNYERNHKEPIPAYHENPRYTGACRKEAGQCPHCRGDK